MSPAATSATWTQDLEPDAACAFLFPGTGSAAAPDLHALAGSGPAAARIVHDVLDAVQEGLPPGRPPMRSILLEHPDRYRPAARAPGVAQLAAYSASVAVDRVLRAAGIVPAHAVGQSFGEIAALVCAGAFSIADGARMAVSLVDVLARRGAGGGMGLLETGEDGARACIGLAAEPSVVVACLNAPSVTVLSGPDAPLDHVLDAARRSGVRAVRLAVPYLSHHPSMAGADDEWYERIRHYPQRGLEVRVHSPVRGRAYTDGDDLHRALADCIVKPVRLPETLRAVARDGATVFTEAGAGNALCACARLTIPGAQTLTPLRERTHHAQTGKSAPGVAPVPPHQDHTPHTVPAPQPGTAPGPPPSPNLTGAP
ncbi:ACP S-malonyltransferase [Spirillospora sp. NBC_01491]|uniref:ACP S-malonyltransferase n=1 Tax=Spirillospora sp. NBC_01491 TaxID=2976007 RepID=UPI002E32BB23|nr:acyltransferase domain-containing protein [Spirillospora sp. NBC_01491]